MRKQGIQNATKETKVTRSGVSTPPAQPGETKSGALTPRSRESERHAARKPNGPVRDYFTLGIPSAAMNASMDST